MNRQSRLQLLPQLPVRKPHGFELFTLLLQPLKDREVTLHRQGQCRLREPRLSLLPRSLLAAVPPTGAARLAGQEVWATPQLRRALPPQLATLA